MRLREARTLLEAGLYDGAYYLAGYAVECALKACIAKRTQRHDFPDPDLVKGLFVHDLRQLLAKANLVRHLESLADVDPAFLANWDTVRQWKPDSRYNMHRRDEAEALVLAIADKRHGILTWLRRYW